MRVQSDKDDAWFRGRLGLPRITVACAAFLFGFALSHWRDLIVDVLALSAQ